MRRTMGPAVIAMWVTLVIGCGGEPPEPAPVIRPIKMLDVGGLAGGTREYPGRLRAGQQADMAFEVEGRIIEWVYKEGQRVEAGAPLAKLDPRDYENSLAQAEAAAENARTYLGRLEQAFAKRAVSEQDITDGRAQVDVAEAEVKIRQKALDDTILRAPFDGIMSRKLVEDFANVRQKVPVLVFEDTSVFEIKVAVPERDLAGKSELDRSPAALDARIRPEVVVSALPDHRFPARLKELATTADPTTRTYQATFRFDRPEEVIVLAGMTAKVIAHLDGAKGEFSVPAQAAFSDDAGNAAVWVVDTGAMTVSRRPVGLGDLSGDSVIVTQGLSSGDVIAISGIHQLREGMAVRRWEP